MERRSGAFGIALERGSEAAKPETPASLPLKIRTRFKKKVILHVYPSQVYGLYTCNANIRPSGH